MNHLPTPKNSENEKILAVHEIRILQFWLIPIDVLHISICYTFLLPPYKLQNRAARVITGPHRQLNYLVSLVGLIYPGCQRFFFPVVRLRCSIITAKNRKKNPLAPRVSYLKKRRNKQKALMIVKSGSA